MTIYLDKKFINMVSPQLEKFSWKKDNLAACRCPICGDSQKNKNKTRGYFYIKNNDFFYKCHNCGAGYNLYNFLKEVSPAMCKEYSLERYKSGENGKSNYKKPKGKEVFKFKEAKPKFKHKDNLLNKLVCLADLPSEHTAVKFANMRMIPKQFFKLLYYTDDFTTFADELDKDNTLFGKEERLVIPFFNSHGTVVGAQGRVLTMSGEVNARETLRYITIKAKKSIDSLWYGLWRVNPEKRVYVVEGPIDSFFLNNCVAMVGASSYKSIPSHLRKSELVFVMDNEPRNQQVVNYNKELIKMGHKVCVWPKNIEEKDLNDLAYRISTRKIQKVVDDNTVEGLEAELRLKDWKNI
tara:strand:+ start:3472 stop:4527 length:1056 start_codon:yes stop_codon:yes gene_type:complete